MNKVSSAAILFGALGVKVPRVVKTVALPTSERT